MQDLVVSYIRIAVLQRLCSSESSTRGLGACSDPGENATPYEEIDSGV